MSNQGNIGHTAVETSMDFLLSAEVEGENKICYCNSVALPLPFL